MNTRIQAYTSSPKVSSNSEITGKMKLFFHVHVKWTLKHQRHIHIYIKIQPYVQSELQGRYDGTDCVGDRQSLFFIVGVCTHSSSLLPSLDGISECALTLHVLL